MVLLYFIPNRIFRLIVLLIHDLLSQYHVIIIQSTSVSLDKRNFCKNDVKSTEISEVKR